MQVIIVSGPEATGKTSIAKSLAASLGYKYITKDSIKERLFDTSRKHSTWNYAWYENKAKKQFFSEVHELIKGRNDVVIESNFIGKDKKRLSSLLTKDVFLVEIYCTAKGMTTFKRFVSRNESGNRHSGHHDRRWYGKVLLEDLLQYVNIRWPSRPSYLTNKLLIVDTTDFSKVDIEKIIKFVKE